MHPKLTEHGSSCAKQSTDVELEDNFVRLKFIDIGFKRGKLKTPLFRHSEGSD